MPMRRMARLPPERCARGDQDPQDRRDGSRADGWQGRALSGCRTQTANTGNAKRMLARALPATRYAYMITTGERCGDGRSGRGADGVQDDGGRMGADDIAIA
jgi:hypothetical protein